MKVKTSFVPSEVEYLTADKEYELFEVSRFGGWVVCDDGGRAFILFLDCCHLEECDAEGNVIKRGQWTIVEGGE